MRTNTKKRASSASKKAPSYVDERILQEMKKKNLAIVTEKADQNAKNRVGKVPFLYIDEKKQGRRITGIEMRRRPPYSTFTCNVLILHELGHAEDAGRTSLFSFYGKEKHAWKTAEDIARRIGFPAADKKTKETWAAIKRKALRPYEPFRIGKNDWTDLGITMLKLFGLQFAIFMALFMISFFFLGVGITTYFWDIMEFFFRISPIFISIAVVCSCIWSRSGHIIFSKYLGITRDEFEDRHPLFCVDFLFGKE